jgi:hypothetical protein
MKFTLRKSSVVHPDPDPAGSEIICKLGSGSGSESGSEIKVKVGSGSGKIISDAQHCAKVKILMEVKPDGNRSSWKLTLDCPTLLDPIQRNWFYIARLAI